MRTFEITDKSITVLLEALNINKDSLLDEFKAGGITAIIEAEIYNQLAKIIVDN